VPSGGYARFIEAYLGESGQKIDHPRGEVVSVVVGEMVDAASASNRA
jgi:hypothetical protein